MIFKDAEPELEFARLNHLPTFIMEPTLANVREPKTATMKDAAKAINISPLKLLITLMGNRATPAHPAGSLEVATLRELWLS